MQIVLFILIVMIGVFAQSLVGFGIMLAMPLCILLLGITLAKPVMTLVAWTTGMVIAVTQYRYINRRELLKMVCVMLIGVLGGLWVSGKVQWKFLLLIYAFVVIGVGVKKLFFASKNHSTPILQNLSLIIAGIIQGLFVSGGSFLAVYSVAKLPDKREFCATVNAVWAIVNTVMITTYIIGGTLTTQMLKMAGIAVIPILVAIWLGGLLTKKVKQELFLKLVYIFLILSGIVLLISNL